MNNYMTDLRLKAILLLYKILYKIKPRYAGELMYRRAFHRPMDLDNPKNLIEKIYWLQYNSDTSMWTLCADKYRVREYVEKCGLLEYMPKLYGHWEEPELIDFNSLPDEFVLKANNGCGTVKIVRDKSQLDTKATVKILKKWLKVPFGYEGGQSHYLKIKPCIIAEELLHEDENLNNKMEAPRSLTDYKIWCFEGKPECILVIHDRVGKGYLMDMYDTEWNRIPNSLKRNAHYGVTEEKVLRPKCLKQMLMMASKLSEPFTELRVDFYVINNKPVIGELTFSSGYGNYTEEFYDYLGSKVDLSHVIKAKK